MSNILIFGGSGFIGQNLGLHYKAKGDRVWLADIVYPVGQLFHNYIGCDIRLPYHVREVIRQVEPDMIINCVGQTSHPLSMAYPASDADVNVLGNLVLFNEYRKMCPETLFVHLSSSTVVGPSSEVIDEDTECHPIDIYSANKLASETYLSVFSKVYSVNSRILRLPNIYGPYGKNDPAYGVLNYWIGQAAQGKALTVYGEGNQLRNVLYIKDAIRAIELAHLTPSHPIFAPSDVSLRIRYIAETIAETWGVDVVTVDWPKGRDRIEIGDVFIESDEFFEHTGWVPQYSLSEGLKEIKDYYE